MQKQFKAWNMNRKQRKQKEDKELPQVQLQEQQESQNCHYEKKESRQTINTNQQMGANYSHVYSYTNTQKV